MITIFKPDYIYIHNKFEKGYGVAVKEGKIIGTAAFGELTANYKDAEVKDWVRPYYGSGYGECTQSLFPEYIKRLVL
ncbi:MAG: hypothetical protein WCD89_15530 [Anaerocolumna sp.]